MTTGDADNEPQERVGEKRLRYAGLAQTPHPETTWKVNEDVLHSLYGAQLVETQPAPKNCSKRVLLETRLAATEKLIKLYADGFWATMAALRAKHEAFTAELKWSGLDPEPADGLAAEALLKPPPGHYASLAAAVAAAAAAAGKRSSCTEPAPGPGAAQAQAEPRCEELSATFTDVEDVIFSVDGQQQKQARTVSIGGREEGGAGPAGRVAAAEVRPSQKAAAAGKSKGGGGGGAGAPTGRSRGSTRGSTRAAAAAAAAAMTAAVKGRSTDSAAAAKAKAAAEADAGRQATSSAAAKGSSTDASSEARAAAQPPPPPAAPAGAAADGRAGLAAWRERVQALGPELFQLEAAACGATARSLDREQPGTLAVLCGRRQRFHIRQHVVFIGRNSKARQGPAGAGEVEVDLMYEAPAHKVSREQAGLSLSPSGTWVLENLGQRVLMVNSRTVLQGQEVDLPHLSLIEVGGIQLLFVVNFSAVCRLIGRAPLYTG